MVYFKARQNMAVQIAWKMHPVYFAGKMAKE